MSLGGILTMFFSLVSVLVGFLYPAYSSYKVVEAKNADAQARWLVYWVVFGLFSVIEVFLDVFLGRVTVYYIGKLSFLIWLQLPQTRGASKLYVAYIQPLVKKHEIQIDNAIEQCEKSYQTQVVSVLRRNGFGFDSSAGTSTSSSAAAMASQMESGDSRVH